jgi:hypothetical protein
VEERAVELDSGEEKMFREAPFFLAGLPCSAIQESISTSDVVLRRHAAQSD